MLKAVSAKHRSKTGNGNSLQTAKKLLVQLKTINQTNEQTLLLLYGTNKYYKYNLRTTTSCPKNSSSVTGGEAMSTLEVSVFTLGKLGVLKYVNQN
jgi:hypothetical protein